MTNDRDASIQTEARVIAFRPRGGERTAIDSIVGAAPGAPPQFRDLARFERAPGRDDYWHRMTVNAVAVAFTVALMVIGIWIAQSMAAMRKNQDCVLMGRTSCAPMQIPLNTNR